MNLHSVDSTMIERRSSLNCAEVIRWALPTVTGSEEDFSVSAEFFVARRSYWSEFVVRRCQSVMLVTSVTRELGDASHLHGSRWCMVDVRAVTSAPSRTRPWRTVEAKTFDGGIRLRPSSSNVPTERIYLGSSCTRKSFVSFWSTSERNTHQRNSQKILAKFRNGNKNEETTQTNIGHCRFSCLLKFPRISFLLFLFIVLIFFQQFSLFCLIFWKEFLEFISFVSSSLLKFSLEKFEKDEGKKHWQIWEEKVC